MDLVMHSYSLRNYPLEHVFAVAAHDGFDGVEVSTWHLDLRRDPDVVRGEVARAVTLIGQIVEACGERGIALVNGFGGWLQGDPEDWVRNGSALAHDEHYARCGEAYRALGAIGAREGVRVASAIEGGCGRRRESWIFLCRCLRRRAHSGSRHTGIGRVG